MYGHFQLKKIIKEADSLLRDETDRETDRNGESSS